VTGSRCGRIAKYSFLLVTVVDAQAARSGAAKQFERNVAVPIFRAQMNVRRSSRRFMPRRNALMLFPTRRWLVIDSEDRNYSTI
jgi:hypothetical protein